MVVYRNSLQDANPVLNKESINQRRKFVACAECQYGSLRALPSVAFLFALNDDIGGEMCIRDRR